MCTQKQCSAVVIIPTDSVSEIVHNVCRKGGVVLPEMKRRCIMNNVFMWIALGLVVTLLVFGTG